MKPIYDWLETMHRIRARADRTDTLFVLMSALVPLKQECAGAGFPHKPIKFAEMLGVVEHHLEWWLIDPRRVENACVRLGANTA